MKKILVMFIAFIVQANLIFAQVVTEKGIGTVELTGRTCSGGKPSDKRLHLDAIEKAKVSGWNKFTAKFSPDKTDAYVANENAFLNNLDNYITEYIILDANCSKTDRVYTVVARVSINEARVNADLKTEASGSEIQADLKGQGIVVMVVPRKTDSADIFMDRVTQQTQRQASLEVDEMISEDAGGVSITEASTQREAVTTGGKTTRKATKRTYSIGDLNDADAQINNILSKLGMRTFSASRLENMASDRFGYPPFLKDVLDQFSGNIGDFGANISPQTREEIINIIIDVGQGRLNYFMLGTVDSSVPRDDPDTGVKKVDVLVNVQLFKIDDFFGAEVVASVGPEIKTAFGETDVLAEKEALKKAFAEATNSLLYKL